MQFFTKFKILQLIYLLLKLASPASTVFNIQTEKRLKIIISMVFNLNYQHFVSSLSYAKHNYFYIIPLYSNSFADLLIHDGVFNN